MSFIKRASAATIASELVSVAPLSGPTVRLVLGPSGILLHYMDVNFKEKIPTITERIKKIKWKQN